MPTIHVTIGDTQVALNVVADLLNAGYSVAIDIDEVPNLPTKSTTKRVKPRITAEPIGNVAHVADDYAWSKRVAERELYRDVDATTVECRTCGAVVGAGCHKASGEFTQTPHVWRVRAAWEAMGR